MSILRNSAAASLLSLTLGVGVVSTFCRVPVFAQAQGTGKPIRVRTKLDGFDIEPKAGKKPNQIGGASRGIGGLTLYAPKMGKAYTLTPTFHWSSDDPAAEFTFRLSVLSAGQGELFQTKVTGGQFTYPGGAPALTPGSTYVWQVTPTNDMLGGPASASILVVGGAERSAIEAALHGSAGTAAADAKVYVEKRLWYDAVQAYSTLISADPARPDFYKDRAELYDQFPQTQNLADVDMTKVQH